MTKSLEAQQEALALMEGLGDREGIADSKMNLSVIYVSLGKLREALRIQEEAFQVYKTLQRPNKMAFALGNLALTQVFLGNFKEALDNQSRSLEMKRQLGDVRGESNSRINLGLAYAALGDYPKALEQYWEALDLYRGMGNKQGEAVTLSNVGDLFNELGDLSRAEEYYQSSLKLRREIQDKAGLTITLKNLGSLSRKRENLIRAKSYLQEALQLAKEIPLILVQGDVYQEMGVVSQVEGNLTVALENLEKALAFYEKADYPWGIMSTLGYMGDAYGSLGAFGKGLSAYQKSLELAQREQHLHTQSHLTYRLGVLYKEMGQEELALRSFLKAIDKVESLRSNLEEAEIRRLYTRHKSRLYRDTIRLLLKRGEVEEALFYLERFRARTFLETLLSGPPVKIKEDSPLLAEEQELFAEIHFLNRQISQEIDCCQNRQVLALKRELESAKSQYEELWFRIQLTQPGYARLKSLNAAELRRLIARSRDLLDEEVALVDYFLDEEKLHIWVITKVQLIYREVPASRETIIREVLAFRSSLNRITALDFEASLKKLHEILIAPIQDALEGKSVLGIIPHEILHFLPFGALKNQRYLIHDYAVFYLPSLGVLPLLREKTLENMQKNLSGELLAMGNATGGLSGAEIELRSLMNIFSQVALYQGPEATEEQFMVHSPAHRILHLATHGVYDKRRPLLSYLELAPSDGKDGKLYVSKVLGMTLGASLVTLSGCETSLPQNFDAQDLEALVSGDEMISLNRAFMSAGAPAVISSLWKVSDLATPALMHSFYLSLKTNTKAEALRRASLAVMGQQITPGRRKPKELSLSHPFFWAPFILMGDWK